MSKRFKWVKRLGQGSFGEVWLAESGDRLVAVKRLLHAVPEHLERFAREARILWQQKGNDHVVKLIDHDLNATPPFLVMEYCEEGSLRKWVELKRGWRYAAGALWHVVAGLKDIHADGGFHRDIKPENLLVTRRDGRFWIKVGDFGVARTPATSTNMTVSAQGTRGYMAPEIVEGCDFHAGADVFSLGVVGIELVTGVRAVASLEKADAPDAFKALLRRMVSANPADRPTLAQIDAELRALMQPAPAPAATTKASTKSGITLEDVGKFLLTLVTGLAVAHQNMEQFRAAAQKKPVDGVLTPPS